jgi:hypothetical protein
MVQLSITIVIFMFAINDFDSLGLVSGVTDLQGLGAGRPWNEFSIFGHRLETPRNTAKLKNCSSARSWHLNLSSSEFHE